MASYLVRHAFGLVGRALRLPVPVGAARARREGPGAGLVASVVLLVVGGVAVFFHLEHWERIFNGSGRPSSESLPSGAIRFPKPLAKANRLRREAFL